MSFCKTCGNLLRPKRDAEGQVVVVCATCSDVPEMVNNYTENEKFKNKLKNLFRSGRAEKQLKTISRSLSMPESQVHDILKALDDDGKLPYGYYDKIERLYVRTHTEDEIPDDLMIDMIKQCYGYDIFGAKGLSNYISLGKNTSVRKVAQSLHGLRKKGVLRGYKRNVHWLFRLPAINEESGTPFFPKKADKKDDNAKNSSDQDSEDSEESIGDETIDDEEEDDDIDYDEEEEQDDSKMVYFADPDNDPDL